MKLKCNNCGHIEHNPFAVGDGCWCGGYYVRCWSKTHWKIWCFVHKVYLFLNMVWRVYEPKSCGIPEPYRARGRISAKIAWEISSDIWKEKKNWEIQ